MAVMLRYLKLFNIQVLLACLCAVLLYDFLPRQMVSVAVDFVIRIHQVPIIPYIVVSLIVGIGSIDQSDLMTYVKRLLGFTLVLWLMGIVILMFMSLAYQPVDHHVNMRVLIEHLQLTNSIGMNYVSELGRYFGGMLIPALCVVILFFAVTLTFMPDKEKIIAPLNVVRLIFESLFDWFLTLLPLSIFILLVHALSVINYNQLTHLSHHIFSVSGFCLVFLIIIFPLMLCFLRGVPYRETIKAALPCLWLTVLAGDCVLALPVIIRSIKKMLRKQNVDFHDSVVGFLVPIVFSIPLVGSIGNLLFIYFASVMYGITFNLLMYAKLAFIGTLSMFAEPLISVPLMIELLNIPHDAVPLFMLVSTFTDILFDTCESFSMIVITYLVISPGLEKRTLYGVGRTILILVSVSCVILLPLIYYLQSVKVEESNWHTHPGVTLESQVHTHNMPGDVFARIKKSGLLSVGIAQKDVSLCFDHNGKINGYEIDLVRKLAKDLYVKPRYVMVSDVGEALHKNEVDIVICQGNLGRKLPKGQLYTQPVLDGRLNLVTPKGVSSSAPLFNVLNHQPDQRKDGKQLLVPDWMIADMLPDSKVSRYNSKRYLFAWSVEPSAQQWLHYLNQWLTAIKMSDQFPDLLSHWFNNKIKER